MDETRHRVWPAAAAGFSSQEEHLTQLKGDVARGYCARHGITPAIARKVRLLILLTPGVTQLVAVA